MILALAWLAAATAAAAEGGPSPTPPYSVVSATPVASSTPFLASTAILTGTPAPFTGVLLSNDKAQQILELAVDGKAARDGQFAAPFWQRAVLLTLTLATTSMQVYQQVKKK